MNAELSARRAAAASLLADFEHDDEAADATARAVWAGRLAAMLTSLLGALDADARTGDSARLTEIRAYFAAFDWEFGGRQYALEALERIAGGQS